MKAGLGFLAIDEPCHEGWENMTISEKGKFCFSCQKEVRDFSNSSLAEIRAAYGESNDGLCGHVPIRLLQEEHFSRHLQQNHFGILKRFFVAAVFCFGSTLFSIDAAKASSIYKLKMAILKSVPSDTVQVKGEVHDRSNNEALAFANVVAMVGDKQVAIATTDIDGKYTLKIPGEFTKVDISVEYLGYVKKIMKGIPVAPGKQIVVDFTLEQNAEYLTEGIMISKLPVIDPNSGSTGKKHGRHKKMPK
ncbi:MAG: carboxypeptidase-like regulatory domain-containing protein [Bacteroidia bacterium]